MEQRTNKTFEIKIECGNNKSMSHKKAPSGVRYLQSAAVAQSLDRWRATKDSKLTLITLYSPPPPVNSAQNKQSCAECGC